MAPRVGVREVQVNHGVVQQGVEADEAWSTSELRSLTPVLDRRRGAELEGRVRLVSVSAGLPQEVVVARTDGGDFYLEATAGAAVSALAG